MAQLRNAFIDRPKPMVGFLYVAQAMLSGAQTIQGISTEQSFAVTYLCGHCVETTLKAPLSK